MIVILKSILILCILILLVDGYQLLKYTEYKQIMMKKNKKHRLIHVVVGVTVALIIHWLIGIVCFFMLMVSEKSLTRLKEKQRKKVIEFNGYKIFKFIMNQISSGILISDAIKSMYKIVDDSNLKQCLIDVSAYYSKTTDLKKSLDILKTAYKSMEVDTLCIAIEQGIYTGSNYETLKRMESLLFKKYIYQIKHETKLRKKRSILSVLLLCMIMILMVAIPVVLDMMNAFNQIFNI